MSNDIELVERLRATEPTGFFEGGRVFASIRGRTFRMDGEPIRRLRNPDGPEAASQIEALRAEVEGRWQPIETAPKKGLVLVCGHWPSGYDDYLADMSWWNFGTCTDIGVFGDWHEDIAPTHWMPLPSPPALKDYPERGDG